jgi:hypothetical protein
MPDSVVLQVKAYFLRKLEQEKKDRRVLMLMSGHFSPFGGSVKASPMAGALPGDFSRHGRPSYMLEPVDLKPGEYALGKPYAPFVFCFG